MTWVLSKWMAFLGGFAKGRAKEAPAPVANETVKLNRLMVCQLKRVTPPAEPGASRKSNVDRGPIKAIVEAISMDLVLAATPALFDEGEKVVLDMLLQGAGSVQLEGKVDWLLDSHTGRRVQISFQPTPAQQQVLQQFVNLQKSGRRGI